MNRASFYINRVGNTYGFEIFGSRLKHAMLKAGCKWNRFFPDVSFIFASGFFRPYSTNILRLDGLYFDMENTLGDSDKLNKPIYKAYKKASGIIFQSRFNQFLYHALVGESNSSEVVIPNGVTSDFCPEGDSINYGFKKTIICSAVWRAHKRLDCIIQGFLEYGDPDAGLIIIGHGYEEKFNHPNIKYLGRITHGQLPYHLRGGDAFIHLSWLDHCPNTVVEALACGLPVLCTHNGGTKEIVGDNGVVIKCEEDYDYTKVALYRPPKCDKKIVAQGIEQILIFNKPIEANYLNIQNIADRYIRFYEEIRQL
jgi:glycosyltransferase involved in cell wall biosynthesis